MTKLCALQILLNRKSVMNDFRVIGPPFIFFKHNEPCYWDVCRIRYPWFPPMFTQTEDDWVKIIINNNNSNNNNWGNTFHLLCTHSAHSSIPRSPRPPPPPPPPPHDLIHGWWWSDTSLLLLLCRICVLAYGVKPFKQLGKADLTEECQKRGRNEVSWQRERVHWQGGSSLH